MKTHAAVNLTAVLKQPLPSESPISPAADILNLGVLPKGLALGYLPFAHLMKRAAALLGVGEVQVAKGKALQQHPRLNMPAALKQL